MMSLLELRDFAFARHAGQRYGLREYGVHLDDVFALVSRFQLGRAYERAAYGHDLLDDTSTSFDEVVAHFGSVEADLIYSVSGPGINRTARRQETINRLQLHPAGINLKLADRCSNLAQSLMDHNLGLVKMYLSEQAGYAPLFAMGDLQLQAHLNQLYAQAADLQAAGQAGKPTSGR